MEQLLMFNNKKVGSQIRIHIKLKIDKTNLNIESVKITNYQYQLYDIK